MKGLVNQNRFKVSGLDAISLFYGWLKLRAAFLLPYFSA